MASNIYWAIYRNLERELIELSEQIYFDDEQVSVYSLKIAELLIRASVEVESISKELYLSNGGPKADDNKLYFDRDCLKYLNEKWCLSKKKIRIINDNFHFSKEENMCFAPLENAHEEKSKKAGWLKAYQAIKHNRRKEIKNATLQHLIYAISALYILNLYYRDKVIKVDNLEWMDSHLYTLDSKIFSFYVRDLNELGNSGNYCIYTPLIEDGEEFEVWLDSERFIASLVSDYLDIIKRERDDYLCYGYNENIKTEAEKQMDKEIERYKLEIYCTLVLNKIRETE